jgi:hypothetical protein
LDNQVEENMKNRFIMILVILLPLTLACTTTTLFSTLTPYPTQTTVLEILHFENELVAFDYPAGTRIFAAGDPGFNTYPFGYQPGGELAVGLAASGWVHENNGVLFNSIGVFRHTFPPGSSLEQVMLTAYEGGTYINAEGEQNGPVTVAGQAALQKTYRVASGPLWYTLQDIWLEKDGSILRLSLWKEDFQDDFQAVADLFVGSLVIKDDLPPFTEQPTPGPTASPTSYPKALLAHYEDDLLSFDYPQGMIVLLSGDAPSTCFPNIPFGGERLVGLSEFDSQVRGTYHRSIQITRQPMPAGSNLEMVMLGIYEQWQPRFPQEPSTLAATGAVTVAGQTGFQWAYRMTTGEPTCELRDVWLERNGQLYIISTWKDYNNRDEFWAFQSGAQALLDSLVIK